MEVMQCGLNWTMMLKKRDIFRKCFADFDFHQVAKYGEQAEASNALSDRMYKKLVNMGNVRYINDGE